MGVSICQNLVVSLVCVLRPGRLARVRLISIIVEGNRTAEIVTAYRNAMEILVEITNRDRYRAYSQPYAGFGGPIPYAAPYMNGPVGPYTTPYANALPNTYTTPYANPTQASYVTPYSNPPVVAGPSGSSQSKAVVEPKSDGISRPIMSLGSSQERVVETNADLSSGVLEERDDEFEGTPKADDEVSTMDIDSFLALANGGVPIGQNDDSIDSDIDDDNHIINRTALDAPPSPADTIDESRSRADEDVQALVNHIAKGLMLSEEPPNQAPAGNPYAAFYSTMDGKQLGAELKRLVAVAHPEVNAIMARDQIHAAHLFYTHLVSRASTQNTPIFPPPQVHNHAHFPPANHWGHAALPPSPPKGYMVQWHDSVTGAPIPSPPQQPAQNPAQPFLLRSNATAPPVVRNVSVSEEQKVATYGFPPKPERRPGLRSGGQKGKRKI